MNTFPFAPLTRTSLVSRALLCLAIGSLQAQPVPTLTSPPVGAPPESFFNLVPERDRALARDFYVKHIDVQGMPVAAAAPVQDLALRRTHEIVSHMLAGRRDLLEAMVQNGMYLIIIGRNQVYTDMPEYRHHPNPAFQNERVRGTGGKPTSFGEENLLSLPLDRYDDESIAVHEFCHTIDSTLRAIDPGWTARRNAAFQNARSKGLFQNAYAASNPAEYWAEICQSYFDCNRINNWNHGPVGTREQLRTYDPAGYELVRATFQLAPDQEWRYAPLQTLPNVTPPPTPLKLDSHYTKFTWAREFTVVGRSASDPALLRANHVIRKMFAYRHDILKALIADGVKLVVLGRDESLSELPELQGKPIDALARILEYQPETKLLVVPEENILADPNAPRVDGSQLIRVFAKALFAVTAARPVDPNWENRGQAVQQYELRVRRLDIRFGEKVRELYDSASSSGKWKGTPAVHDPMSYWAEGVLAYFDATGQVTAPLDAVHPINTRSHLEQYDPALFNLVHETMAYSGRVDWRHSSP